MFYIIQATESLTRAKKNISAAVIEIEKTHEYFRISSYYQDTINNGIKRNDYVEYFDVCTYFIFNEL